MLKVKHTLPCVTLLIVVMKSPTCLAGEATDSVGSTPTAEAISAAVSEALV
jgi:hypothetical protein